MKCVHVLAAVAFLFSAGCGGSSSETPMPLEPVPHAGPDAAPEDKTEPEGESEDEPPEIEASGEAAAPAAVED